MTERISIRPIEERIRRATSGAGCFVAWTRPGDRRWSSSHPCIPAGSARRKLSFWLPRGCVIGLLAQRQFLVKLLARGEFDLHHARIRKADLCSLQRVTAWREILHTKRSVRSADDNALCRSFEITESYLCLRKRNAARLSGDSVNPAEDTLSVSADAHQCLHQHAKNGEGRGST